MIFHIPAEKFCLFVTAGMTIVFTALCLPSGDPVFMFAAIVSGIGAIAVYREKETVITVDENDKTVTIVKNSRFLNRARPIVFSFGDIARITDVATKYKNFHVIRLASGKSVALPLGVDPQFDAFMRELKTRLKETSPAFAAAQDKEDQKQNRWRIVTVIGAAAFFPVCLVASVFGDTAFYAAVAVMAVITITAAVMTARH